MRTKERKMSLEEMLADVWIVCIFPTLSRPKERMMFCFQISESEAAPPHGCYHSR